MPEEGIYHALQEGGEARDRQARLKGHAVVHPRTSCDRRQRPLVLPTPHAQHRGPLQEPPARLELDNSQAVEVERDEAEQPEPGAADGLSKGDVLD